MDAACGALVNATPVRSAEGGGETVVVTDQDLLEELACSRAASLSMMPASTYATPAVPCSRVRQLDCQRRFRRTRRSVEG